MREILFRGKTPKGEWCEGLPTRKKPFGKEINRIQIIDDCLENDFTEFLLVTDVIPQTVGQYTGLTDKNGTKIFEGDIGRYKQTDGAKINGKPIICIGKVVYNEKTASFAVDSKDEIGAKNYDYFPIKDFEIIGNIHDNHELLKGGVEE